MYWQRITFDYKIVVRIVVRPVHHGFDLHVCQHNPDIPIPACDDPGHAWATAMAYFVKAGSLVYNFPDGAIVPAAIQNAKSGFASLATVAGEIDKYTPAQP